MAVVPEDEMVDALVEWAEFINEHGVEAALARADTGARRARGRARPAALLDEQGDDANARERTRRPDPQARVASLTAPPARRGRQ